MRKVQIGTFTVVGVWLLLAMLVWFGPRTEVSEAERRKLEPFPAISAETLLDGRFMSKFEAFSQDQFPFRDAFRRLKAQFSSSVLHKGDNNGIYLAQGFAAKLEYPLKPSSVQGALGKFQKIYDRYLHSAGKILFSVVPDKGYYLAAQNGFPSMDYAALFSAVRELDWAEYVDLTDCLSAESYYRTDPHWRQEALHPAAEKLAAALGADISSQYCITPLERPFYGAYYGQAALPLEPETMSLMESDVLSACTVTNAENKRVTAVYDMDKLTGKDLYDVFLSGPVSILTVENPSAQNDRELLIFRDSFGSSFAPLLIPAYSKVTLIDIRYVPTDYLDRFVTFANQDVLFLYSTLVLNNSTMLR